jgi:hypothetical protein
MKKNLDMFDVDRKYALRLVAVNLGITEKYLEQYMCEMRSIVVKCNAMKKCANGTYIPMYDMCD